MKNIVAVVGFVLLVGCGSGIDGAIKEYEGYKEKMCACKDAACTEKVEKDIDAWMEGLAKKFDKDTKPSKEQEEKFDKIENEIRDCKRKAGGSGD